MGKITLEVLFDNAFAIFYPENPVAGKLKLTTDEELKISGVNATLQGKCKVKWSEGQGQYRRYFSAREFYMKENVILFAPERKQKEAILRPGTYEYPFKFQLPKDIPSSFEGGAGKLRYQIKAHVVRSWSFDIRRKQPFTLVNPLDLNILPDLEIPVGTENEKHFCCCCCKSDPIRATMVVKNRRGYVPGETISFSSEITNTSSRNMTKSVGRLVLEITCHAEGRSNTGRAFLTQTEQGPIKPGGSDIWGDGKLLIPAGPPSFLQHCSLIDIKYLAEMQVVPPGCAISLKVPVEVIIGTIPLKRVADQYNMNLSTTPIPQGPPSGLYSDYQISTNVPQVTFSESAFGPNLEKKDGKTSGTRNDKDFSPFYTYYRWDGRDPYSNFTVSG